MKKFNLIRAIVACDTAISWTIKNSTRALLLLTSFLFASSAYAVTINSFDTGWYSNLGVHASDITNYSAGTFSNGPFNDDNQWTNFFAFDLSTFSGIATSATLIFNVGGTNNGVSNSNNGIYTLYDISTPIPDLLASSSGHIYIFDDLRSGTTYGSKSVSTTDTDTIISISLNSSALAAITNSFGDNFALGGWVDNNFRIGGSTANLVAQLNVTTVVPVPPALLLFASGLLGLIRLSKRD